MFASGAGKQKKKRMYVHSPERESMPFSFVLFKSQ